MPLNAYVITKLVLWMMRIGKEIGAQTIHFSAYDNALSQYFQSKKRNLICKDSSCFNA